MTRKAALLCITMLGCLPGSVANSETPCSNAKEPRIAAACSCDEYLAALGVVVASAKVYWIREESDLFRSALAGFESQKRRFSIVAGSRAYALLMQPSPIAPGEVSNSTMLQITLQGREGDEGVIALAQALMENTDAEPIRQGLIQYKRRDWPSSDLVTKYFEGYEEMMVKACREDFNAN
ncbi:hypothetical protein HAT86_11240 [Roseovarius gahaiensis]|uniref:Uncharacterized protein n=1 Tax=Roseovarius gahaiensis TaxID=2716691 RepID=A0A967EF65_9RHOB|nr:hypothetical protein [Roseovarius gahaiensis]NHQ75033.1 hypothetical protein [Roseovarius gahaiensis]